MPNPVVYFEIPADDLQCARAFYENTFGWSISTFADNYFSVVTKEKGGPGIDGGLMKRVHSQQPFANYVQVDSIDRFHKVIEANGGTVVLPKQAIPGAGWYSAFKDPEGNILGLHELEKKK